MKIVYRITEKDYMEAQDLFVANEPWYRRISRRLLPWLGGLMIAIQVVYLTTTSDNNPALVLLGLLVGLYLLYCGFALRRYFRRRYRTDKRYQHEFTAEVSEEGVKVQSENAQSQMKWSTFTRFLESDNIFMLFHAEWVFNIFPKRAFTPEETAEFRELARRSIVDEGAR